MADDKKQDKIKSILKDKTKMTYILLIAFFAMIAIYCASKIFGQMISDRRAAKGYEQIAESVVSDMDETTEEARNATEASTEATEETEAAHDFPAPFEDAVVKLVDFDTLWDMNEDVVAWIQIPGTIVDYPVAQGKDNDEYMRTLLNGKYHRFGTLFIDYRNAKDFTNDNTVIYGHHIKAGDMFCCLENYKDQEFYEAHPYGLLYLPDGVYGLEFFSGIVTPSYNYIQFDLGTDEEFTEYIEKIKNTSTFTCDVEVTPEDRIVTLYTCDYDFEDARYYLSAKLVKLSEN